MPDGRQEQTAKEAILNGLEQAGDGAAGADGRTAHDGIGSGDDPALDRLLMVHHNVYQSFSWPGGHADGTENLLEKALEEVREERVIPPCIPSAAKFCRWTSWRRRGM